ncbi:hypothetical protein [uncultured Marinobacter sp.]
MELLNNGQAGHLLEDYLAEATDCLFPGLILDKEIQTSPQGDRSQSAR